MEFKKAKLITGFAVICLGLVVIIELSYTSLNEVVSEYEMIADTTVPNMGHISGLRARGRQVHAESIKLALYYDNPEESKKTLESLNKALKRYQEIDKEKTEVPYAEGEKEVHDNVNAKWKEVFEASTNFLTLYRSDDPHKIDKIKNQLIDFEDKVRAHQEALLKLDDFHVETGAKWSEAAQAMAKKANTKLLLISSLTLIFAILISMILAISISKTLNNLAVRLGKSADDIANNSDGAAKASTELSASVTEEAAALQETVAATSEVTAMINKNAENSQRALSTAENSRQASNSSKEAIMGMLNAMDEIQVANNEINEQIVSSNKELQQIVTMIGNISEKTKVINDIVFQTKLLSFNASVEAARAGEQGKGFSVVAEEVSKLANMSGEAAQDISKLLEESVGRVQEIIQRTQSSIERLIKQGTEKVASGKSVAQQSHESIESLIENLTLVFDAVKDISVASKEQAIGISEINKAMEQMETVTSQNATAAQECSSVSEDLTKQVDDTKNIVSELLAVVYGDKTKGQVVHKDFSRPAPFVKNNKKAA